MALQDTIDMIERQKRLMPDLSKFAAISGSTSELFKMQQRQIEMAKALRPPESVGQMIKSLSIPNLSEFAAIFGSTELFKMQQRQIEIAKALQPPAHIIQMIKSISAPPAGMHSIATILAEVGKNNPFLSSKIFQLNSSQQQMAESLAKATKIPFPLEPLNFRGIEAVLNGFSASFIQGMAKKKDWSDIDFIEQANKAIIINADKFSNSSEVLEIQDLSELFQSIVIGLREILSKAKSKITVQFIMNSVAVFGVLLSIYSLYQNNESQKESSQQSYNLQTGIAQLQTGVTQIENNEDNESIVDMSLVRRSITKEPLRFSVKSNSQIVGVVQKGQQITVVKILHKYLFIAYIDKFTKIPTCGFVLKKYFVPVIVNKSY
jgi:hypothetical protein